MSKILVKPDGTLVFIYSDALAPLLDEGKATVKRASHVEPHPDGGWTADMTPHAKNGPVFGPFALRQEALDAEVAWLEQHL
jgi:hypothetical protein